MTVLLPATSWVNIPLLPPLQMSSPYRPLWIVFYQGVAMQRTVEQDSENCSNHTMCAINPGHIPKTFTDAALREVVDSIAGRTDTLLEIVEYNFEVSLLSTVYSTDLSAVSV
jgi:hypothetical protein